jgi:hypothetical protein
MSSSSAFNTTEKLAFHSYKQVSGSGRGNGDGTGPARIAHLPSVVQINLDNVYHTPELSSSWYGSDNILDKWFGSVESKLEERMVRRPNKKLGVSADAMLNANVFECEMYTYIPKRTSQRMIIDTIQVNDHRL